MAAELVKLTEGAIAHLKTVAQDNNTNTIMFGIKGGGCAGFEYSWDLITKDDIEDQDVVTYEDSDLTLVLDGASIMYVVGSTIDYKKDIMGSMIVVDNPLATSSCGCGTSVALDPGMMAFD